jgi:hypothetical protein
VRTYIGDGKESVVLSYDEIRVLKEIKPTGVYRYLPGGGYDFDQSFEAVAEKAAVIKALEGMPTTAFLGKNGQSVQLIKEGVADADISETALDEAFSTLMESEVIRSGRDSRSGVKVPRGILSRNVLALAKLQSPKAMRSFSSLVKAVRHYWGIAFSRARHLTRALDSGELNANQYHEFMGKMLGLNEQDAHNKAAVAARNEILLDSNIPSDGPFSLGGNSAVEDLLKSDQVKADSSIFKGVEDRGGLTPKVGQF